MPSPKIAPRFARTDAPALGNPPIRPPGPAAFTAGAASRPLPGNAAAGLIVGAQAWGTDNAPTNDALPKPAAPSAPAPEAVPATRADPNGVAAPASAGGAAAFTSMPLVNPRLAAAGIKPSPAPIAAVSGTPSTVCSADDA